MTTPLRDTTALLAISLCVIGLCGCGGSSMPGDTIAEVGSTPITKPMLSQWMAFVVGGDYFEHVSKKAPAGLVSDPPNYQACLEAAQAIVGKSASGAPALTHEQLVGRCRQLYLALKQQALELLISIDSTVGAGEELGIKVSNGEIQRMLARIKTEQFPKEAEYQTYLSQRDWTPATELFQLKRNIITAKIVAKFRSEGGPAGHWQEAYGKYVQATVQKWTAKTTCRPGYVVPTCKQYTGTQASSLPGPALLLENLAAGQ